MQHCRRSCPSTSPSWEVTTRALLPGEIARIADLLAAKGRQRERLLVILAAATGYRISELLTLRVDQLITPRGEVARELTIARKDLKGGRSQ